MSGILNVCKKLSIKNPRPEMVKIKLFSNSLLRYLATVNAKAYDNEMESFTSVDKSTSL